MGNQDETDRIGRRAERALTAELSRRDLLRRLGFGAVAFGAAPAIMAACGGGQSESDSGGEPESIAAETGTEEPSGNGVPVASGTLDYLGWEGEDIPDAMADWKQANGVEVKASYIGSLEDIPAKIIGGGGEGIDLLNFTLAVTQRFLQTDILQPLDESKIPNLTNLLPYFAEPNPNVWSDEQGNRVAVPLSFGVLGITYDSAVIEEPKAWSDLLEPEFQGKLGAIDEPNANAQVAGRVLGFDLSQLTPDQADEMAEWLRPFIAQTKGLSPSWGDMTTLLVNGEILAGFLGWAAMNVFAQGAGNSTVTTNIAPTEGSWTFVDAYTVARDADNPDTAYAWINESLVPSVNAAANTALVGGVTVTGAAEELDETVRALYRTTISTRSSEMWLRSLRRFRANRTSTSRRLSGSSGGTRSS